ncbi:Flavodoxin [Butyrivibrio proteoclasticus]|uniref:Flavodoxin n=1 Tax=Butyrivibrio proteoclasticus TaxID=43305 RepID=A0A1I5RL16_9FIRM|nr:flavodoxin domain-containing protein [Butyrivibrio proteoclasticus]SFP59193.1 Flavodoxin [Butyrivibrio proteoclasticus]
MGKTAIVYYSKHHGNTKKVLDAIKGYDPEVVLIDVTDKHEVDLTGYDRIGLASGIYYLKFAEQVLNFARVNLPTNKDVFFIATAGNPTGGIFNAISEITEGKHCSELGRFTAKGFDTFGPLKVVGGIQKGHPTEEECWAAVEFYKNL